MSNYTTAPVSELISFSSREMLSTGIDKLDAKFPFPAGYYVICANPGAGKGWFALWLTRIFYTRHLKRSVYFSLEMAEPLVRERIFQAWSDLTQEKYKRLQGDEEKLVERVYPALSLLRQGAIEVDTFHVEDTKHQTPKNFYEAVKSYYEQGYRVFHFDHLHELEGANDNNRNQAVTELWAKVFQDICKELPDIWLFIYAQPNGAAAKKKYIRRTDIAGSKAITQKCEFFLSLNLMESEADEITSFEVENRQRVLFLDKSRVTSESKIGFLLYFDHTGNFLSDQGARIV